MNATLTVSTSDWFNPTVHRIASGNVPLLVVPPPQSFKGTVVPVEENYVDDVEDILIAGEAVADYEAHGLANAMQYSEYRASRSG